MRRYNIWDWVSRVNDGEGGDPPSDPPIAADPPAVVDPPEAVDPPADPPPQVVPVTVMQRRLQAMTAKQKELERENERLRIAQQLDPTPIAPPPADDAEVRRRAALMAVDMSYAEKVNNLTVVGNKVDPQFLVKINNMAAVHGEIPRNFVETLLESVDDREVAAQILLDLTNDHTKAATLFSMSPAKQAAELTRLELGKKGKAQEVPVIKKKDPPPPITPKNGLGVSPQSSSVDLFDDKVSTDDWIKAREKQVRENRRF